MEDIDKENKKRNGFEMLSDFFSNLDDSSTIDKDKHGSYNIDLSWFFTENLQREIIQKTVSRLMKESNPEYESRCKKNNRDVNDINKISIRVSPKNGLSFSFKGADNWSRLQICNAKDYNFKVPTIDVQKFKNEIGKTIASEPNPDYTPFLNGLDDTLNTACENFINYYKYLKEEKDKNTVYSCVVSVPDVPKPVGNGTKRPNNESGEQSTRKNEIIPFSERAEILKKQKPIYTINVGERKLNGEIEPNAYSTFVYSNLLDGIQSPDKGYMFICEPISGERTTRVFYISPEEWKKYQHKNITENFGTILSSKLGQPLSIFAKEKGTTTIAHTNSEAYKDKIDLYLHGTRGKTMTVLKIYQERIRKLYNNPDLNLPYYVPRVSASDVGDLGISESGKIDRTAQNIIAKSKENNKAHIEL